MQVHPYVFIDSLMLGAVVLSGGCFPSVQEDWHIRRHTLDIPSLLLYGFNGRLNQDRGDRNVDQQKIASS